MAGRIATIFTRVRDSLSDANAERWDNDRILRLIDEAQKDLAFHARLLRTKVRIAMVADTATYSLPSEAFLISRVIATDAPATAATTKADYGKVPIISHDQMDEIEDYWEADVGDGIEHVIFDKLQPGHIKVHPIPETGDIASSHLFSSVYGVLVSSSNDILTADFGLVTDIADTETLVTEYEGVFGIVTEMTSPAASVIVYYYRRPLTLDTYASIDVPIIDGGQSLEIDEIFDKAIKHYVVGMALRDDKDTQNRLVGNEELAFYERELKKAHGLSSKNSTQTGQRTTDYNDGFRS